MKSRAVRTRIDGCMVKPEPVYDTTRSSLHARDTGARPCGGGTSWRGCWRIEHQINGAKAVPGARRASLILHPDKGLGTQPCLTVEVIVRVWRIGSPRSEQSRSSMQPVDLELGALPRLRGS